jgi:multisubunit Na+/H+ antiporter MnhC subunit
MDNRAYEKYKQENPDVNTPLSTYDYVDQFAHQLTNTELVVCVAAVVLAVFALYKIFTKAKSKRKDKHSDDHQE